MYCSTRHVGIKKCLVTVGSFLDQQRIVQVEYVSEDFMFVNVLIFDVNNIVTAYIDNLKQTVPSNSYNGDAIVFFRSFD